MLVKCSEDFSLGQAINRRKINVTLNLILQAVFPHGFVAFILLLFIDHRVSLYRKMARKNFRRVISRF